MDRQANYFAGRVKMIGILILLFFLCTTTTARASESKSRTVKAGFFAMDGYHMIDEDGIRSGYGYDFLQAVTRYVNFDYEYIGYDKSWEDMQNMLLNGEIDLLSSARKTKERAAIFDFSKPIGTSWVLLNVAIDDDRYAPGDYVSYNGMRLGLLRGNSRNADVAAFAKEKGFCYTACYYDTPEALADALQNGTVDAVATSSLRKTTGEKTLNKFAAEEFYVIVKKGNQELLSDLNYAISQMDNVEGDWKNDLYFEYYKKNMASAAVFTEREKKIIREYSEGGKVLLVSSNCDKEPYSYVENGELKGILPEIFSRYMQMCGISYEFYAPESREEYQELTTSGKIQVFLDARMGASRTEDLGAYCSPAYITLPLAKVTRRNFDGNIHTVAVAANQGLAAIGGEALDGAGSLECADQKAAVQAVADGRADATFVYGYTAAKYVNEDISGQLVYNILETPSYAYSISVSKDTEHEILGIITKCIYALSESEVDEIITHYTSFSPADLTIGEYLKTNPWLGAAMAMLAALVVLIIVAILARERASRRLYDEEQKNIIKIQEQMNIINAISCEYDTLYLVNLDDNTFQVLRAEHVPKTIRDILVNTRYTDAVGEYIRNYVVPEQRAQLLEATGLDVLKKKLPEKGLLTLNYQRCYEGATNYFQMNCARVPSEGGISQMVVGYRNVDDVVAHERNQQNRLREALKVAQHANAAKSTFLSNMSHDIRTPMNAIIGFATVALRRLDNTEQVKDSLEKVLAAGNHLLRLINDILDMSRIESGHLQLHEQECNLSELIHNLVDMNQA